MSTASLTRIFLVDDDEAVTDAMTWMLDSVKLTASVFNDPIEFVRFFQDFDDPACVILDMRMAGMGGLEVLQNIMARRQDVPVTMLSAHGDVPITVRSMKLGAFDFLEKPLAPQLFLDTVNLMLRKAMERFGVRAETLHRHQELADLSPRESEIFSLLLHGHSSKEIAKKLDISPKTVDIHRANILKKLNLASYRDLIQKYSANFQVKD